MAELIFWGCAGLIVYTYLGYYLILKVLVFLAGNRRALATKLIDPPPRVSVIVAVYNEARVIQRRIENLLGLDYPRERLEIIVASDGSVDGTVEIAREFAERGVLTLDLARRGKAIAQNDSVAMANGEIILFTDADTEFTPDFLRAVVRRFLGDNRVGCVVGNLAWKGGSNATARTKQLYWKLETEVRRLEGRLGIVALATGAGLAVRNHLWKPLQGSFDDSDIGTPLDVALQGFKVVLAEDALLFEVPFSAARSEFRAKVRGVSKGIWKILARLGARGWIAHPLIGWQLMSHTVLRWLVPFFLLGIGISVWFLLSSGWFYLVIAGLEIIVLMLAIIGYIAERSGEPASMASIVFNILLLHAGLATGFVKGILAAATGPWETE